MAVCSVAFTILDVHQTCEIWAKGRADFSVPSLSSQVVKPNNAQKFLIAH